MNINAPKWGQFRRITSNQEVGKITFPCYNLIRKQGKR